VNGYFFLMVGVLAAGAFAGLLFGSRAGSSENGSSRLPRAAKNLGFASALIASLLGIVLSALVLFSGKSIHLALPATLVLNNLSVDIDPLSAFFLGTISLLSAAVSMYSFGYVNEYLTKRNVGLLVFLFNLFLFSMAGVVVAGNAVPFLILWELMSLTTFFLINYEHENPASRRAAFLYIAMSQIGTAFLIVMFVLFYVYVHSFSFAAIREAAPHIPSAVKTIIFLCALVGFGIKAGIIPLHIWLPEAHPAAPSNVSALMSGVMIKTGIYGMVRVFFDFLGPGPEWWGILVLGLAATSAVLGVLYALTEHDLKRLLAFHSIENIGIILMGVGAALLFSSLGNNLLAALGLAAALFHVVNHALFKGLLFLGAGSVLQATHTRNIEDLGGLIRRMPTTSLFFLVGSVAISALPPLNGFVSEWLTYQALLLGFNIADLPVKIVVPLTVALLALTGALAAACFVKAFGITFLGLPRSRHAEEAHEASRSMLLPMGMLAALCILLGVAPGLLLPAFGTITESLLGVTPEQTFAASVTLNLPVSGAGSIAPGVLAASLLALVVVPVGVGFLIGGKMMKRTAPTWACGLERVAPRTQYTATGFSKPIRMIFSNIYRATHEIEVSEEVSPYFKPRIRYELKTESVFEKYVYVPVLRGVLRFSRAARATQTGHIQTYLAYIFVTLLALLLLIRG